MWGHNQQSAGTTSGTATSRHGLLGIGTARHKSSPGRIAEEGASGDQLDNLSEQQLVASEDGSDKSPNNSGGEPVEEPVRGCDSGEKEGDSMEGGGYYPAHHLGANHLGGGGGLHQPLVRGGGFHQGLGPLEEGEVRRRGGSTTTRDGLVIIERRPSQEGIQPAEMQVTIT